MYLVCQLFVAQDVPHAFLLPHEWFRELYNRDRGEFVRRLAGNENALEEYWDGVDGGDLRRNRGVLQDNNKLKKCGIPLALHGDGVRIGGTYARSSFESISFEGILGERSGGSDTFVWLITGYFKETAAPATKDPHRSDIMHV